MLCGFQFKLFSLFCFIQSKLLCPCTIDRSYTLLSFFLTSELSFLLSLEGGNLFCLLISFLLLFFVLEHLIKLLYGTSVLVSKLLKFGSLFFLLLFLLSFLIFLILTRELSHKLVSIFIGIIE